MSEKEKARRVAPRKTIKPPTERARKRDRTREILERQERERAKPLFPVPEYDIGRYRP